MVVNSVIQVINQSIVSSLEKHFGEKTIKIFSLKRKKMHCL